MSKHTFAGSVALLFATTALAHAEVDANTIWSDWQETLSRFGATLSAGSEDYSGGTLTLEDVSLTTEMGDASRKAIYGPITMVEQSDGTVRIVLPAEVDLSQELTVEDQTTTPEFKIANDGLSIVASEENGVRTYDISANSVVATIRQKATEEVPPIVTTLTLSGYASTYRSGIDGDTNAFDETGRADSMAVAVRGEKAADGRQVSIDYDATGITGGTSGNYGPPRSGPVASLADLGVTYAGTVGHSGSTLKVVGTGEQGDFSADGSSSSAEATFDLGGDALSYALASDEVKMSVKVPQFPVPVDVSMAEISSATTLPMGEPGAEQPFALAVALRDLVVDDAIWSLFDPTGQLPRDPATLSVDVDGTAVMNADIFGNPQDLETMDGPPGEVKTLNLKDLTLTVAGAALKGMGKLTFPEPKPVPEPVGTIELTLDGGFALVDKIVALGFIPAEQGAFVKGMAGAVAKPVGDDQLESTIEFMPGGGITANGLPLK